jgi:peptidylprolyl isomerase
MRFKILLTLVTGLFIAGAAHAQTAPASSGPPPLDPENTLLLDLSTGGRVTLQLRPDMAPRHVERMKTLARRGFYNGLSFHRVIEGFMAQGGDPQGNGTGGSELPDVEAEFNALPHVRGALAAARAESPNSANSQFFIMLAPRLSLDGKYTVYGRVVSGMNFVDAIERGEPPVNPTRILRASIGSDNLPPPTADEAAAAVAAPPGVAQVAAAAAAAAAPTPPLPGVRMPAPAATEAAPAPAEAAPAPSEATPAPEGATAPQ